MAIKGKKKSHARGSQARRRPAAAPRPVVAARKPPWYRTTTGLTIAGIAGVTLLLFILWAVNSAKTRSEESKTLRESLGSYTSQMEAIATDLDEPVVALLQAPASEDLATDAREWGTSIDEAQAAMLQVVPPSELSTAHALFTQAVTAYRTAASTAELSATVDGQPGVKLVSQAVSQVSGASAIWDSARSLVDEQMDEAGLAASDLDTPGSGAPPPAPPSPSPAGGEKADGGKEDDDGGKGGKGGDGKED